MISSDRKKEILQSLIQQNEDKQYIAGLDKLFAERKSLEGTASDVWDQQTRTHENQIKASKDLAEFYERKLKELED